MAQIISNAGVHMFLLRDRKLDWSIVRLWLYDSTFFLPMAGLIQGLTVLAHVKGC